MATFSAVPFDLQWICEMGLAPKKLWQHVYRVIFYPFGEKMLLLLIQTISPLAISFSLGS